MIAGRWKKIKFANEGVAVRIRIALAEGETGWRGRDQPSADVFTRYRVDGCRINDGVRRFDRIGLEIGVSHQESSDSGIRSASSGDSIGRSCLRKIALKFGGSVSEDSIVG